MLDHLEQVIGGFANAVISRIIWLVFFFAAPAATLIINNHMIVPPCESLRRGFLEGPGIGTGAAVDEHNAAIFLVVFVAVALAE